MKTYNAYKLLHIVLFILLSSLTTFAGWPEMPSHNTYVLPSYFPKNGQGDYVSSGFSPGFVRERMSNFYEGWWREISYYHASPINGLNIRGYFMDTKTVGEIAMPWAWNTGIIPTVESNMFGVIVGKSVADIKHIYTGTINPKPIAGRSFTFQIGNRFLTDTEGGGQVVGDGIGTVNHSTGAYSFKLNIAAPEGIPIRAFYTCFIEEVAPSIGAWANFSAPILDQAINRFPDGQGEQFDERVSEIGNNTPAVLYPRFDQVTQQIIDDPLIDGFWTPGERFVDLPNNNGLTPPNGHWNQYIHAEDYWIPMHNITGIAESIMGDDIFSFLSRSDIGDTYADYDFNTITDTNNPARVMSFSSSPCGIWIADLATGTNILHKINELDLTPPLYYFNGVSYFGTSPLGNDVILDNIPPILEGDALHKYVHDNTINPINLRPIYKDIPQLGRFEYECDNNGRPFIYRSNFVIELYVFLTEQLIINAIANPNIDVGGVIFSGGEIKVINYNNLWNIVHKGENAINIAHRIPATIRIPIYYAIPLWGSPRNVDTYLNIPQNTPTIVRIGNCFIDAVGNDNQWTPSIPEESFSDFISWWDATIYPNGGFVAGLVGTPSGTLPKGSTPNANYWTYGRYCKYIIDNYPGDTNGLIRRCGDGKYDGPENWAEADNNQMIQTGNIDISVSIREIFSGWDFSVGPKNIKSYQDWWCSKFGANSTPVGPSSSSIPNIHEWKPQLTDFNQPIPFTLVTNQTITGITVVKVYGSVTHPPLGTTWTYDSPREFYDMASSLYHNPDLGSLSAVMMKEQIPLQFDVNPLAVDYGGDLRLGEPTSPWNNSIWGQDRGDCNPNTEDTKGSGIIPLAGPYAYNTHANYGYDAANQLNLEFATWRTDGLSLTGPRGGHFKGLGYDFHTVIYQNWNSAIAYAKDHRDVNLNGMIDQGETIPARSQNYTADPVPLTIDDGMNTIPLFGWERFIEDNIDTLDEMEDFNSVAWFNPPRTSEIEWGIVQPSWYNWFDGARASNTLFNIVGSPVVYEDSDGNGKFTPDLDAIWIDYNNNIIYDNNDFVLFHSIALTNGTLAFGDISANIMWIDLPTSNNICNGAFDFPITVKSGGIDGEYLIGDALFYDVNTNRIYELGSSVNIPLYMISLYNQLGVSIPSIFFAGQKYGTMTRERHISGFNQNQPVALNMPVPASITHEQCHDILKYPDLYDYDRFSQGVVNNPVANGDLMAIPGSMWHGYPDLKFNSNPAGGYWPALRGVTPQELNYGTKKILTRNGGPKILSLYPVERFADQYYVFRNRQNPLEYFTINFNAGSLRNTVNTNNEQVSPYYNPIDRGIVIGHSDYRSNAPGWPQQQRSNNRFTWLITQADGKYNLEDGTGIIGPEDTFGNTPTTKVFTAYTRPPAKWFDQTDSGMQILDIILPTKPYGAALVTIEWTDPVNNSNDGIPDEWKKQYGIQLDSNGLVIDSDGDNSSDYQEYITGTIPVNKNSIFGLFIRFDKCPVISFPTINNRIYQLLVTDDLINNIWRNEATNIYGNGSTYIYTNWFPATSNWLPTTRQFYKGIVTIP